MLFSIYSAGLQYPVIYMARKPTDCCLFVETDYQPFHSRTVFSATKNAAAFPFETKEPVDSF